MRATIPHLYNPDTAFQARREAEEAPLVTLEEARDNLFVSKTEALEVCWLPSLAAAF
jgi:hypothetical protein